jgi:polysaccharide biosynthesis protein PslH
MAIVVSIVSYPFLPARVGGQKGVALFSKYFSRYHQLICVTTHKNDPHAAEGYQVLNVLSDSPLRYINLFYFFKIRSIIRNYNATHLIIEHPYYGWLGILVKWFCGTKLIVHSHNIEGLRWKTLGKWWWSILWLYEKYTHRQADYNFFIHDEDLRYGIEHFRLDASKCITMTYGIERDRLPPADEIQMANLALKKKFGIEAGVSIILFNGAFNYLPNLQALDKIINVIIPLLNKENGFRYRIIICGREIPDAYNLQPDSHINIAGFVDDIDLYFKGADIFINPISEGGGIKTKLVEALGFNLNAVSTRIGATGVDPAICNGKLLIAKDGDWPGFARLIIEAAGIRADIPKAYFDHFYWGNSTQKAAEFIEEKVGEKK